MQFFILAIATLLQTSVVKTEICNSIKVPEPATVPQNLKDWKTNYTDYSPIEWNEQCTGNSCDPTLPNGIKFNVKESDVDRRRARTCLKRPKYSISSDGYPLNPAGRTGFKGRGMLKHWGPNHLVKIILVRKTETDTLILIHKTANATRIPENFVDSLDESLHDEFTERKIFARLRNITASDQKARTLIKEAKKKSKDVLSGNVPTTLNTDHAWVEMHLRVIDCKDSEVYCDAVGDVLYEQNYEWASANETDSAKEIGKKPHLIGEDLTEDQVKEYGVFCRMKKAKIGNLIRQIAKDSGIVSSSFGVYVLAALLLNPWVAFVIVLAMPVVMTIGLSAMISYKVYDFLRCE